MQSSLLMKTHFIRVFVIGALAAILIFLSPLSVFLKIPFVSIKNAALRALNIHQYSLGSMNGVRLKIMDDYQACCMEYSGESVWNPTKKPPVRNYDSDIDSVALALKWPSMEHKYEHNNYQEFIRRDDVDGSKFWLDIEVQSDFENLSTQQKTELEEYRRTHPMTKESLLGFKNQNREKSDTKYIYRGIDPISGLKMISLSGPAADDPRGDNYSIYWLESAEGKTATRIECKNGKYVSKLEPTKKCVQYFLLPELHAQVKVYYHENLLDQWSDIERKSRDFVLGLRAN